MKILLLVGLSVLTTTAAFGKDATEIVSTDPEHNVTLSEAPKMYILKLGDKRVCYLIKRPDGYGTSAPICLDHDQLVIPGGSSN